jgi:hypothetical protein
MAISLANIGSLTHSGAGTRLIDGRRPRNRWRLQLGSDHRKGRRDLVPQLGQMTSIRIR